MSSTGTVPLSTTLSTTTTTTRAADTSVSGSKGQHFQSPKSAKVEVIKKAKHEKNDPQVPHFQVDIPKITLLPPSFPAMDFLLNECTLTRVKVDTLQMDSYYIFKIVSPIPGMKATVNNSYADVQALKEDTSTNSKAIQKLEETVQEQGKMLASIQKTQEDMLQVLKTISEQGPSFTNADRNSLSKVIQTQTAYTQSLEDHNSNVKTLVVHALPADNLEGERCAK